MDVFGLTPIDTALSVYGLNLSQALLDYIFNHSKIGYVAFVVGFLISVGKTAKSGSFRLLVTHFAIWIACMIIVLSPTKADGDFKSAWEAYSPSIAATQSRTTAKSLKNEQTQLNRMPVVLSYVGQSLESFAIGAINFINPANTSNQHDLDQLLFLKYPFRFQLLSLGLHREVMEGVDDIHLREAMESFSYDHFLPALTMLKYKLPSEHELTQANQGVAQTFNLFDHVPSTLTEYYSPQGIQEWGALKRNVSAYLIRKNILPDVNNMLREFYSSTQQRNLIIDNNVIDALVQGEARHLAPAQVKRSDWLWQAGDLLLQSYPFAQGWANLTIYLLFPIVICLVMTLARVEILFNYAKAFLWVKSLSFTAALAYLISLFIARVQAQAIVQPQGAINISWFYQEPHVVLGAGLLSYLIPMLMFVFIYRGINFKFN